MSDKEQAKSLNTLVFNTFVWLQIFNEINNRRLDNKLNIFEGITKNWYFIIITLIMIGGQVLIIFVGGEAFKIKPLNATEWGLSVGLGAISLPWGAFIRFIPDAWVEKCIPRTHTRIRIRMPWRKKTGAKEVPFPPSTTEKGTEINGRESIATRPSGGEEFAAPLRTWTSLRGERAGENIRIGYREYVHDRGKKAKAKAKRFKMKGWGTKEG
jgi:Ca2+-transporting ATPase